MKHIAKLLFLFLTLNAFQHAFSQGDSYAHQEKVFKSALKYNDYTVARAALFSMMVLKPELTTLKDSLAILYFNIGAYPECILVCKEVLEKSEKNLIILEIKAISEQSLGLVKESLSDYEKLYSNTKNVYHLYQIASLQYELKRFGECEASVNAILADKESETKEININITQQKSQKVLLKAAAYNMRGVLALETNKTEIAKQSFDEALKISPDFELAKNNKNYLEEKKTVQKPASNKVGGK